MKYLLIGFVGGAAMYAVVAYINRPVASVYDPNSRYACRQMLERNFGASARICLERGYLSLDDIRQINGG